MTHAIARPRGVAGFVLLALATLAFSTPAHCQWFGSGNASRIQGRAVQNCVPTDGQVFAWSLANLRYECVTPASSSGIAISGTPSVGDVPIATSSSAAAWHAPAAGTPAAISGTYAAIAATTCNAANSGQVGLATDSLLEARCTGSAWVWRMNGFNVTTPPSSAGCSWGSTQGTAAVSNAQGGLFFTTPLLNGSNNIRFAYNCGGGGYPIASFTWTVGMLATFNGANFYLPGFCISDGTKIEMISLGFDATQDGVTLGVSDWTTQTAFSAWVAHFPGGQWGPTVYLTYVDDLSTTRSYYISNNPNDLQRVLVFTASRTAFLTPTRIGPCNNVNNATNGMSTLYFHWSNASI